MRHAFSAAAFSAALLMTPSVGMAGPTVLELYTSQGCSSCPPADAMMADLIEMDDVIALSLHVDYWDYLGWKDDLADPAFTQRQHSYAHEAGGRTVYTPQMVIGGKDHVIGSRPMQVMDQLRAHAAADDPVIVTLERVGDVLQINATAEGLSGDAVVQVVRFIPEVVRDIKRGENAGRTISYLNVVTSWTEVGAWDVSGDLSFEADVAGDQGVAVIVQNGRFGPILGAAQLR